VLRRGTIVGGAGLGVLMLAGLTLAGALNAVSTPRPMPEAVAKPIEPSTLSASQPRLEQAAPRPTDLPGGASTYSPTASPKTTVRRRCSLILDPGRLLSDVRATLREIPGLTRNCHDFQRLSTRSNSLM